MWVKQCHFYHPWLGMIYTNYLWWNWRWFMIVLPTLTLVSDAVSYILWVHNRGHLVRVSNIQLEMIRNCSRTASVCVCLGGVSWKSHVSANFRTHFIKPLTVVKAPVSSRFPTSPRSDCIFGIVAGWVTSMTRVLWSHPGCGCLSISHCWQFSQLIHFGSPVWVWHFGMP